MSTLIFIAAMGITLIALLIFASSRSSTQRRKKRIQKSYSAERSGKPATTQWRAVKIAPDLICCAQAEKLAGRVFLATESPSLPLAGCGQTTCKCRYVHLEDRRSGGDRRIELGELGAYLPTEQEERRQIAGRRKTDLAA